MFEPKQTETRSVSGLFRFVSWNQKQKILFCFVVSNLYRHNRNKQNCFETNRNNPNFFEKIPKYAFYHTVSVAFLFDSVQSKHRNSLFRYRTETTETNVLFRIVPKLVRFKFQLFRIENSFEGHPTLVYFADFLETC